MTTSEKPHRRWYQFRLRTLLVLMALLALPFAWIGSNIRQAQREQAVIHWVNSQGGTVTLSCLRRNWNFLSRSLA